MVAEKLPNKKGDIDTFFSNLSFELVYTPKHPKSGLAYIRDGKYYSILFSAITENIDVLLMGTKILKT